MKSNGTQIPDEDGVMTEGAAELLLLHNSEGISEPSISDESTAVYNFSTGQGNLDTAITILRQILKQLPAESSYRSCFLSHLARGLLIRFNQSRQQHDINEGILWFREVLREQVLPHPERLDTLITITSAFRIQFYLGFGDQQDLNNDIQLFRETLELLPLDHPFQSIFLGYISDMLLIRLDQGVLGKDFEEAIQLNREGLSFLPPLHPTRSRYLSNLANALLALFEQRGQQCGHLDEAISLHQEALALHESLHPGRHGSHCGHGLI